MDDRTPAELRRAFRGGDSPGTTAGLARGFAQLSLTILPSDAVEEFVAFADANPQAIPVLDVLPAGAYAPDSFAADADLRLDLAGYRSYRDGAVVARHAEVASLWRDDLTCVLAGCSYTFDEALEDAGIALAHVRDGASPPIYRTSQACVPHGAYAAPLVVTMRPIPEAEVARAAEITARYPDFHGAPVHVGDPSVLGIHDLAQVDYGDAPVLGPGEVPVFWACNVTRHLALQRAGVPFAITNAPSRMFVTDVPTRAFEGGSKVTVPRRRAAGR